MDRLNSAFGEGVTKTNPARISSFWAYSSGHGIIFDLDLQFIFILGRRLSQSFGGGEREDLPIRAGSGGGRSTSYA